VFYEFLLTLDLEIRLVWHRRLRGATLIFFLNRYITLAKYLFTMLSEHAPTQTVSISCARLWKITNFLVILAYMVWAAFSTMRVFVLSQSKIYLPVVVLTIFLFPVATETVGLSFKGLLPLPVHILTFFVVVSVVHASLATAATRAGAMHALQRIILASESDVSHRRSITDT
ncbi:hypothetical protein DICSQDRAFT_68854, partial [Dichomitus squalens LYAD-421 SS1]